MSVYKKQGRSVYSYDFTFEGRRFSGSTGETNERQARQLEKDLKQKARAASTIHRHGEDVTVKDAFARYLHEQGQYHRRYKETDRDLGWLMAELKPSRLLSTISNSDVSRLVAKRRGQRLSNATVNRYVIERLRAVMLMARDEWDCPVRSLNWKRLRLKEARQRVREMTIKEQELVLANITPRYIPIVEFAVLSGFRLEEAVNLTWRDIDWHEGIINVVGKGGKPAKVPLSNLLRALLWPLPRTSETVFGVTYSGVKSAWRRCRKKSGIVNLKFHDLRHTCATRSLRNGMDIRLVKKLLRHEDISTTMRYAHVTMDDLRTAMDATSPTQITTGRKNKSSK